MPAKNDGADQAPGRLFFIVTGLLIAIVGIVIARQLILRDLAQQQAAADRLAIAALSNDVDKMIARQAQSRDYFEHRAGAAAKSVRSLQACQLAQDDTDDFSDLLINFSVMAPLPVISSGYEAAVHSGALTRLSNTELRDAISDLMAGAEYAGAQVKNFSADLGRASEIVAERVAYALEPEDGAAGSWQRHRFSAAYDFESLCADTEFRNAMVELLDSSLDRLSVQDWFDADLKTASTLLDEYLRPEE